jgi:hypothetical protein
MVGSGVAERYERPSETTFGQQREAAAVVRHHVAQARQRVEVAAHGGARDAGLLADLGDRQLVLLVGERLDHREPARERRDEVALGAEAAVALARRRVVRARLRARPPDARARTFLRLRQRAVVMHGDSPPNRFFLFVAADESVRVAHNLLQATLLGNGRPRRIFFIASRGVTRLKTQGTTRA